MEEEKPKHQVPEGRVRVSLNIKKTGIASIETLALINQVTMTDIIDEMVELRVIWQTAHDSGKRIVIQDPLTGKENELYLRPPPNPA